MTITETTPKTPQLFSVEKKTFLTETEIADLFRKVWRKRWNKAIASKMQNADEIDMEQNLNGLVERLVKEAFYGVRAEGKNAEGKKFTLFSICSYTIAPIDEEDEETDVFLDVEDFWQNEDGELIDVHSEENDGLIANVIL